MSKKCIISIVMILCHNLRFFAFLLKRIQDWSFLNPCPYSYSNFNHWRYAESPVVPMERLCNPDIRNYTTKNKIAMIKLQFCFYTLLALQRTEKWLTIVAAWKRRAGVKQTRLELVGCTFYRKNPNIYLVVSYQVLKQNSGQQKNFISMVSHSPVGVSYISTWQKKTLENIFCFHDKQRKFTLEEKNISIVVCHSS